jgi:hypothetical protein
MCAMGEMKGKKNITIKKKKKKKIQIPILAAMSSVGVFSKKEKDGI